MKEGIEDLNPRTQTIKKLEELLKNRLILKEKIIMSIDANKITSQPIKLNTISSLIHNLCLINLKNTILKKGKSHKSGRLIDYWTITSSLSNTVKAYGYLPYDKITTTDHRLSYLDLDIHLFF